MSNVIEVIQQPAPVVQVVQQPAMVVEVEMPSGVSSVDAPLTYDPVTQRLGFNPAQVTGLPPSATAGTAVVDADPRLTNARPPTAHKSTHATGGSDALTPADIGAEPAGTSAAGMASHLAASDPHPQYATTAEAAAAAPVQSVAGKTGAVTLTPADAGADPAGTASAAVAAHVAAADPHSQYTTAARVRDVVLTGLSTATNAAIAAADSILAAFGKLQAQITAHFGAGGAAHADATTSAAGFMAAADKTKLDGIATGATANSTDAQLRDRATHTGSQAISTVSGLQTALDGKEAAGTAAASMTAHLTAADPHSQYTTTAEAAAAAPVQSVAGRTGAVTIAAADISDSTAAGRAVLTAADAAAQRTALGLAIGTDVQGYDADLQAIGALAGTAGLLRKTAANTWGLDTASYLTGNQTITVSGDATGSGATAITLTLANTGVSAGTYNDSATSVRPFTVDAKGRVTSIGAAVPITPAWAAITGKPTTLSGYGITDAQPLDADLTAIAALAGTAGLLRKTAADTWTLDTAAYLTGNQSITLSGDATGSGATAISVTLANTGVSAGTYRSVTVDAKGRVTAGTNPSTLAGYGITDAQPLDSDLTAIAALTHAADNFLVSNGSAWVRQTPAEALVSLGLGTPTGTGNVVRATSATVSDATLNGQTRLAAGTAAAPALTTIGDLDTGVFFPAANTWAVATGGSERMRIDSSGNVGIGTTAPTNAGAGAKFVTTAASTVAAYQAFGGSSTDARVFADNAYGGTGMFSNHPFLLYTNSSERMRITSGGDVGIGTTSPGARLHVSGPGNEYILAQTTNTTGAAIGYVGAQYSNTSTIQMRAGQGYTYLVSTGTTDPMLFGTNGQERMRITSGGDVGIGTTNPNQRLDVAGNVQWSGTAFLPNAGIIRWGTSDSAGIEGRDDSTGNGYLLFAVNNEKMRILPSGNVGIGTTNPQATLHVAGTILSASSFGNLATLQAVGGTGFRWTLNNDGTYRLQRTTDGFSSVAATPMLFDASGNVGIGTQTPAVKLEVAGQIRTEAPTGGTAANWRLGTVHTVSPTSPNRTIEVDIGGTIYYLHAKTTND